MAIEKRAWHDEPRYIKLSNESDLIGPFRNTNCPSFRIDEIVIYKNRLYIVRGNMRFTLAEHDPTGPCYGNVAFLDSAPLDLPKTLFDEPKIFKESTLTVDVRTLEDTSSRRLTEFTKHPKECECSECVDGHA